MATVPRPGAGTGRTAIEIGSERGNPGPSNTRGCRIKERAGLSTAGVFGQYAVAIPRGTAMRRRDFLRRGGSARGGSWLTLSMPTILATASVAASAATLKSGFRVLSPQEAIEFEAIAAQIIPSGDSPGAREAGVIYFIDTVLADIEPEILGPMRRGLLSLQADILKAYDTASFADLSEPRQIEALQAIEDTSFFETLRFLTIRSEEHTSELQSLRRISYAVFCL